MTFLILMLIAGCKQKNKNPVSDSLLSKTINVNAIIVTPRMMVNNINTTGTILANEEVELRSEVTGRIVAINFQEGTHVTKEELLVKIDDRDLQAQLKKLLLDEQLEKDDVFRQEKLFEMKAVSQQDLDKTRNVLGQTRADIDLVKAQIAKTEIYAPFSGYIGLRSASPGGYVSSSMLIARLQDTDPIKIEFNVPEKYREKIHTGTNIKFKVEGNDSTFSGKIYAIEPKIDPITRNVLIRAICLNPKNILVPGAFAEVEVILDNIRNALVVPSEAIIPVVNGEKVYLCKDGKARSQLIVTGLRTENEVRVEKGLHANDTVLTTGFLQLKEDMKVNPAILPGK